MKPIKIKITNGNLKQVNKTNDDSTIAIFLQLLGWATIITGVIIGIIYGKNSADYRTGASFNIIVALSNWMTFCTSGAILIGFGSIITYLKMIAYNQQEYLIDSPISGELIIDDNVPVEIKETLNQNNDQ